MKVERFPVYAPAALAGIAGAMPATITTRAITIHMRRRRTDEPVEPFRERQVASQAQPLREQLAAWIDSTGTQLGDAQPDMPDGVTDRPAEIWEPLLAIADTAGGHWPDTARDACRHFVLDTGPSDHLTRCPTARRPPGAIHPRWYGQDAHHRHPHRPVRPRRITLGRPRRQTPRQPPISKELDRYGVKPKNLRLPTGGVVKGYRADGEDGLADVWSRYLPAVAATGATTATAQVNHVADTGPAADPSATAATEHTDHVAAVAAVAGTAHPANRALTSEVAAAAAVADETRGGDRCG